METATVAGFRQRTGDYQRGIDCNGFTAVSAEQSTEFEQLEIRHSEEGEQLHGEVGKLSYAFLFFEDLIQFDISAKRKGGRELEEKLERIGKRCRGYSSRYVKKEGRVYASGFLTKDLTPEQAMKQVFEIADYFRE